MSDDPHYILDADSFIRAKREHYAPDFCPAFWDALLHGHEQRLVSSVAPIRAELIRGNDALSGWVQGSLPEAFFAPVDDAEIQLANAEVLQWSEDNSQYNRAAKQKFASGADPWLIAYAATRQRVLVTYEVPQPNSKVNIKLPDVARVFKVKTIPPYVMLRQLQVKFELAKIT